MSFVLFVQNSSHQYSYPSQISCLISIGRDGCILNGPKIHYAACKLLFFPDSTFLFVIGNCQGLHQEDFRIISWFFSSMALIHSNQFKCCFYSPFRSEHCFFTEMRQKTCFVSRLLSVLIFPFKENFCLLSKFTPFACTIKIIPSYFL